MPLQVARAGARARAARPLLFNYAVGLTAELLSNSLKCVLAEISPDLWNCSVSTHLVRRDDPEASIIS